MNAEQIEKLNEIGTEWTKNGMHRIYINNVSDLYGLHPTYSQLNGTTISNTKAGKLRVACSEMKIYYDFSDDVFHCKTVTATDTDEIFRTVVAKIQNMIG